MSITTCLWFDGKAEEAAEFYVKVFTEGKREAKIARIARYSESGAKAAGQPVDSVMTAEFELDGMNFFGLNGGPMFKFSPATSFVINCETQEEVDYFWDTLTHGGKESQCGWLDDKFGISWQVVPAEWGKIMSNPDPVKAEKAMKAMLGMKKLDIEVLRKAAE